MPVQRVLSVITARGGSKRLPQKNLKKLCGQTLIERTVRASLGSKNVDQTILSSDCSKIIEEALRCGCDVPFTRPSHLATDDTKSEEVLEHAIKNLPIFDWVLLLQPTSPFRTSEDIDSAFTLLRSLDRNSCVGVTKQQAGVDQRNKTLFSGDVYPIDCWENGRVNKKLDEDYALNGSIYLIKISEFLEKRELVNAKTIGVAMSAKKGLDIDTFEDFELASALMESHNDPS